MTLSHPTFYQNTYKLFNYGYHINYVSTI